MKKHNPYTPILLREASGTEPKVFARFEFGKEKSISLKGRPPNSTGAPEHRPSPMPLTDTAQVWTTRPLNSTFPSSSRRHEPATPPDQARGKAYEAMPAIVAADWKARPIVTPFPPTAIQCTLFHS